MSEWQPIETAPRDESYFLAWNGHWRGVVRAWRPNERELGEPEWIDETSNWVEPPPTHWMPLPAPPQ